MDSRPSGPVRFAVLVCLLVGIFALPFLFIRVLPLAGDVLPGWIVGTVCVGFLCSVTVVLLGFLSILPVLWITAALYDRGYLPEGW